MVPAMWSFPCRSRVRPPTSNCFQKKPWNISALLDLIIYQLFCTERECNTQQRKFSFHYWQTFTPLRASISYICFYNSPPHAAPPPPWHSHLDSVLADGINEHDLSGNTVHLTLAALCLSRYTTTSDVCGSDCSWFSLAVLPQRNFRMHI